MIVPLFLIATFEFTYLIHKRRSVNFCGITFDVSCAPQTCYIPHLDNVCCIIDMCRHSVVPVDSFIFVDVFIDGLLMLVDGCWRYFQASHRNRKEDNPVCSTFLRFFVWVVALVLLVLGLMVSRWRHEFFSCVPICLCACIRTYSR